MVKGIIIDFFSSVLNEEKLRAEFLMAESDKADAATCIIKAEIPKNIFEKEIQIGNSIAFDYSSVFINLESIAKLRLNKIGYSSGTRESFNALKKLFQNT